MLFLNLQTQIVTPQFKQDNNKFYKDLLSFCFICLMDQSINPTKNHGFNWQMTIKLMITIKYIWKIKDVQKKCLAVSSCQELCMQIRTNYINMKLLEIQMTLIE
ncbi:hypothetical protein pb186bvf_008891 [Paramecium bursaria]